MLIRQNHSDYQQCNQKIASSSLVTRSSTDQSSNDCYENVLQDKNLFYEEEEECSEMGSSEPMEIDYQSALKDIQILPKSATYQRKYFHAITEESEQQNTTFSLNNTACSVTQAGEKQYTRENLDKKKQNGSSKRLTLDFLKEITTGANQLQMYSLNKQKNSTKDYTIYGQGAYSQQEKENEIRDYQRYDLIPSKSYYDTVQQFATLCQTEKYNDNNTNNNSTFSNPLKDSSRSSNYPQSPQENSENSQLLQKLQVIFTYYVRFGDRSCVCLLGKSNFQKMMVEAGIRKNYNNSIPLDLLFIKHTSNTIQKHSLTFFSFLNLLPQIGIATYPKLSENQSLQIILQEHLLPLHDFISSNTEFGIAQKILKQPIQVQQMVLLKQISPILMDIYQVILHNIGKKTANLVYQIIFSKIILFNQKYFVAEWKFNKTDHNEISYLSEQAFFALLRDFEIFPKMITKSLAFCLFQEVILSNEINNMFSNSFMDQSEFLEELGEIFTFRKFGVSLIRLASLVYPKRKIESHCEQLILLLEKIELSKGYETIFPNSSNRSLIIRQKLHESGNSFDPSIQISFQNISTSFQHIHPQQKQLSLLTINNNSAKKANIRSQSRQQRSFFSDSFKSNSQNKSYLNFTNRTTQNNHYQEQKKQLFPQEMQAMMCFPLLSSPQDLLGLKNKDNFILLDCCFQFLTWLFQQKSHNQEMDLQQFSELMENIGMDFIQAKSVFLQAIKAKTDTRGLLSRNNEKLNFELFILALENSAAILFPNVSPCKQLGIFLEEHFLSNSPLQSFNISIQDD